MGVVVLDKGRCQMHIDCEQCAKYGKCKPDKCNPYKAYSSKNDAFRLFKAKTDDVFEYCPYCKQKLYHPKTTIFSRHYKEKVLQCRNQDCWAVKDEIKRKIKAGEQIDGDVYVTVGYLEMQVRMKEGREVVPIEQD